MGSSINRFSVVVEVLKDFFDDRRIFDTGNDLNDTATLTTGFNVDIEHTFEALKDQRWAYADSDQSFVSD